MKLNIQARDFLMANDYNQVRRFATWVRIGVLFTPWGETLIRRYYQEALTTLSHMPNVCRAPTQTNLSCSLDWMEETEKNTFSLWTTFHPSQTAADAFLEKCEALLNMGIRFSVGAVGLKEDLEIIREMRNKLPNSVYLWINAFKRKADYYTDAEERFITEIDPYFHWNNQAHPSFGKDCRAGHTTFSVDGKGAIASCHFIKNKLANLYQPDFEQALIPRTCTNTSCKCHIGYVHMPELK
ncbi:MAG: STM4011 family radical SAM protein [Cytophagales bacterium]|nr:STM4011 family radical SAM protein [Cytophagales bacterium]